MQNGVEPSKRGFIAEDQTSKLPSVNGAVNRDNAASENPCDFSNGGTAWAFKHMGDVIRVENLAPMPLQHARNRAFATGDSACNRYSHGSHTEAPEGARHG